ncbi:hypothetical protein Areg01_58240 [Actinoplanes regularis]|nr:hypothetical protein Areg01_58240 [Actinoplanes regularis]
MARSATARSATSAGDAGREAVARSMTAQKSSVRMHAILPVPYDSFSGDTVAAGPVTVKPLEVV